MAPTWRLAVLLSLSAATAAAAQGVRDHTRPPRQSGTTVTESQAEALTLTVGEVTPRIIQTWIRVAGRIDQTRRMLSAEISGQDAELVKVGQRVRAFPPASRSSMSQAFVTRVVPRPRGATVQAALASRGHQDASAYVMEIVVERGPFLAVPNEALIEEGDQHVVYVEQRPGHYVSQEIRTGLQGELFTQVLAGIREGDRVVTFGSFFIDAEHKLKGID